MRLNPCRRSDRPQSASWIYRLFLALAFLSLSGCADEEYEPTSAYQDQLRAAMALVRGRPCRSVP